MKKKCSSCGLVNWQKAKECSRCNGQLIVGEVVENQIVENSKDGKVKPVVGLVFVVLLLLAVGGIRRAIRNQAAVQRTKRVVEQQRSTPIPVKKITIPTPAVRYGKKPIRSFDSVREEYVNKKESARRTPTPRKIPTPSRIRGNVESTANSEVSYRKKVFEQKVKIERERRDRNIKASKERIERLREEALRRFGDARKKSESGVPKR